eukprot:scaffold108_cov162-Amphora_coffeaeformis.AAC.9
MADFDLNLAKEISSPRFARMHSEEWMETDETTTIRRSNSFDETMSFDRICNLFERSRSIQRSLSEDALYELDVNTEDCITAWTESVDADSFAFYDPWLAMEDNASLPFKILGTDAKDESSTPHVLSPPLMDSLQKFLPFNKQGENFWMKYSLIRDGASTHTFLRNARGSKYTILALETVDGEVFGAFLGEAWRKDWNYYGTGQSFLWRMRRTRGVHTHSVFDQAKIESEIDVFRYTGENSFVQQCTTDKIAVGGGGIDANESFRSLASEPDKIVNDFDWGAGLLIDNDLLHGSSSPCLTYGSPSLSKFHQDGSPFEIINIELWTLTPCISFEEAEKLELGRLFFEKHARHI